MPRKLKWGGSRFKASPGKKFVRPQSPLMAGYHGIVLVTLATWGTTNRIVVHAAPDIKQDPISKNRQHKKE
jgi:hypothetical protein